MKPDQLIYIVLVNYNGTEDTRRCLESLSMLQNANFRIILVDNASQPDPVPVLNRIFPSVVYLRAPRNLGWAGGNNLGIRYAMLQGARSVMLLNNDTVVEPLLLSRLLKANQDHAYGVLGPLIVALDAPEEVMEEATRFNVRGQAGFFHCSHVANSFLEPPHVESTDIVNGCCMLIDVSVFRRIGLMDERFFLVHEESDFCLRALQAGFDCGVLAEGLVRHLGSSAFKRTASGLRRYYDCRNLYLLIAKHRARHSGGRPFLETWVTYLRYLHHRYTDAIGDGEVLLANAVVSGFADAVAGRFGPRPTTSSCTLYGFRWLFVITKNIATLKSLLHRNLKPPTLRQL